MQVDVLPDTGWRLALMLLGALAGGALAAWLAAHAELPTLARIALVSGCAAAAAVGLPRWQAQPQGRLGWDGQAWWWAGQGRASLELTGVTTALDLGGWMLLRLRPAAGSVVWLALSQRSLGPRWRALRTALIATRGQPMTAPHPAGLQDETAGATPGQERAR